jgi:large conductance mechanosensitive channel
MKAASVFWVFGRPGARLGLLLGGVNFASLKITLKEAVGETAAVTLNYGAFLQTVVDFVIVAFAIFLMIKGINSMRKKQAEAPAAPAPPPNQEILLTEIRDLLKNRPLGATLDG